MDKLDKFMQVVGAPAVLALCLVAMLNGIDRMLTAKDEEIVWLGAALLVVLAFCLTIIIYFAVEKWLRER